jgi:hypothetical protein
MSATGVVTSHTSETQKPVRITENLFIKMYNNKTMEKLNTSSEFIEDESDESDGMFGSVYDQYPGDHAQYPKGPPTEYPFPSQYFNEYSDGEVIGKSSAKDPNAPLIVTSGVLTCDTYQSDKQAFTDTYNFRVLMNGMDNNGVRVGWTHSITNAVVTPVAMHSNKPSWAGMHLFSRYQTSNDLYVASYRFDGKATIKKKINGTYTTLAVGTVGSPVLGETYKLQFTVKNDSLSLYVNGSKKLTVNDSNLTWGTSGLRLDYCDCYVEYLRMTTPKLTAGAEDNASVEGSESRPERETNKNGDGILSSFYNYLTTFF